MQCQWELILKRYDGSFFFCPYCGAKHKDTTGNFPHSVHRKCEAQSDLLCLGNAIEKGLSAVHLTKELITKIVGKDCGCEQRKRRLNNWTLNRRNYELDNNLNVIHRKDASDRGYWLH